MGGVSLITVDSEKSFMLQLGRSRDGLSWKILIFCLEIAHLVEIHILSFTCNETLEAIPLSDNRTRGWTGEAEMVVRVANRCGRPLVTVSE